MKKISLFLVFYFSVFLSYSQYTVRMIVSEIATEKKDDVYVAGNFNSWDPKNENYKLKILNGARKILVLSDMPPGDYSFKFTRGGWNKVETTSTGADIENHQLNLQSDTTITFTISGWKDNFPDRIKAPTATPQVFLMDSAFYIPQLNRYRKIWIYLPKSYFKNQNKSYPVIYMQDGQNLFDNALAPFGEWGIDECLDSLQQQLNFESLVVGIGNSPEHRLTEYNPFDTEKYGKGEGKAYVDFLVNTLKPYIDSNYNSLRDPSNTVIAGSSMGGLIALYALLKYPEVFGSAGIFSPSFWIAPEIYKVANTSRWNKLHKIFFYAGGKESRTMERDIRKMEEIINQVNPIQISEIIYPLGEHSEKYWRMQFPNFYKWLAR